jgi:hypothetical protein
MLALTDDPRFAAALLQLAAGDYYDASDVYEELFFEAVRDEVPFVRVFLQLAVGLHHLDVLQWRPGIERLEEGIVAIGEVTNARGFDLRALRSNLEALVKLARVRSPATRTAAVQCVAALRASAGAERGPQDAERGEGAKEGEQGRTPVQLLPAAEIEDRGQAAEEHGQGEGDDQLSRPLR